MKNISKTSEQVVPGWAKALAKAIIAFLTNFMSETLAQRLVALVLICAQVQTWQITELSGFCTKTVYKLRKSAKKGQFSELFTVKGGGRPSKLSLGDITDKVLDVLEKQNFHTYQEIADMIHDKFDVTVSVSAVRRFLKKHGYKRYKSGSLPAKADPVAQRVFYENTLLPLMEKAEKAKDVDGRRSFRHWL